MMLIPIHVTFIYQHDLNLDQGSTQCVELIEILSSKSHIARKSYEKMQKNKPW